MSNISKGNMMTPYFYFLLRISIDEISSVRNMNKKSR